MPRKRAALLAAISACAGPVLVPEAGAQTSRPWPDSVPPCNGTLQACIDAASPGDEIRLNPSFVIQEAIAFSKPLTLRAEPGHLPAFGAGYSIHAGTSDSGDQTIRIEGLTLEQGSIEVDQTSTGTSTIELVGNTIESKDPAALAGINVVPLSPDVGPLDFLVSGNVVSVEEDSGEGIRFRLGVGPAASGAIRGNTVVQPSSGVGIVVYDATSVDVIANRVDGGSGVFLFWDEPMTARVLDNQLNGEVAGIDTATDGVAAFDLTIVNNTIAGNQYGITVPQSGTSEVTGVIANNAITGSGVAGIQYAVANPGLVSVSEHHDLFFDNAANVVGGTPGAGSVFENPLFAGGSDFHLQPGSPAIDAGDDASVAPDLTTDLDGSPRIQGQHVDIGAFETAPEPTAMFAEVASSAVLAALARSRREVGAAT
jgi:hypothetical protein